MSLEDHADDGWITLPDRVLHALEITDEMTPDLRELREPSTIMVQASIAGRLKAAIASSVRRLWPMIDPVQPRR